jgi:hypothetical protein
MKQKTLLLLTLLLTGAASSFAQSGTCGEDLSWTLSNGTLTIGGTGTMTDYSYSNPAAPWVSYNSSITTVIIEDGVTSIGNWAFDGFQNLTSITVANSVTSIGESAFFDCPALTSITLPSGLTSIGMYAFTYCHGLTSVTLPAKVTTLGESFFYYCNGLTAIQVEDGNTHFSAAGGILFNKEGTTLLFCPAGKTGDYAIPDGVTTVGMWAFFGSKLKTVSIAQSVTLIEHFAFGDCQDLTDVTVFWHTPSEVTLSPRHTNDVFEGIDKSAVFLHVPQGTEAAYQAIETWKDFLGIDWTLLSELTVNSGTLKPDFAPGVSSYSLLVPVDVESIVLTTIPFEGSSIVSGNSEKALIVGKNTFEITVTASYGRTRSYALTVFRQPENYLLRLDSHADTHTQMTLNTVNGTSRFSVITGRDLYYYLQTGSFSGNFLLHLDLENGVTCEHSVAVQPNSLYKIRVYVMIAPDQPITVTTPVDIYGNPGTPYINYTLRPWTITASEGGHTVLQTVETTVTGTVTGAMVANVTQEGSLTGIVPVEKTSLCVYPNPVSESFRIEGITVPTQITVTDVSGKTLLQQTVKGDESISVGHLPKGVYLVRVNGMTAKIIKN